MPVSFCSKVSYTILTVIISLYLNKTKKRLNCFIYIALAKHYWAIKLREFKSDKKNTLPDKSGNPESIKNTCNSSKAFQLMCP